MAWKKRPGNWLYTYDTSKLSRSPLCPLLNLALWADRCDSQYPMGPSAIHPVAQPQGSQGSCSRVYRCKGHRGGSPPANHPRQDRKAFGHGLIRFFHSHGVRGSETRGSKLAVKWGWKLLIPPRNMRLGWAQTHRLAWCKHLAVTIRIVSCLCSWERHGTCGRGSVFCAGSLITERVRENRTARPRGGSAHPHTELPASFLQG